MNDLILKYRIDVQQGKVRDSKWTRLSFAKYLMQHYRYFDAIRELNRALEIQEQKEVDKEIYQCLMELYQKTKSEKALKRCIDQAAANGVVLEPGERISSLTPANRICVYAIAKNEQQFVDRWYQSMKEADQIVVLDTGSFDSTVEKLRAHGVTVKVEQIKPWRFDQARNKSLALVPDDCNILVCTDLDEVLQPGWAKVLRQSWIEGSTKRGYYKYTWSHLNDGSQGRTFKYDKIHSKGWFWKYPVHEMLYFPDNEHGDVFKQEVIDLYNKIHLHHYPDRNKSRRSYLSMLELRAQENPEDWYGLIYLAHEYYYRGYYQKSIDLLNKILKDYSEHYNQIEKASCYLFMGDSHMQLKNLVNAQLCYQLAIDIDKTYREPYLNMSKALMEDKKFQEARQIIEQGIRNSYRHYTWLQRDTSWTWQPYDLLCLACYYSGDIKNSALYAAKALEYEPTNERLKNNLRLCLQAIETIV